MKIFNVEFFEPYYLFLPILALFFLFLFYKNRNKYQNFSAFNDLKQVFKRNSFLFPLNSLIFTAILLIVSINLASNEFFTTFNIIPLYNIHIQKKSL